MKRNKWKYLLYNSPIIYKMNNKLIYYHKELTQINNHKTSISIERIYLYLSNTSAKSFRLKTMRKEMISEKGNINQRCLKSVKKTN
jgi:hypothetical protein